LIESNQKKKKKKKKPELMFSEKSLVDRQMSEKKNKNRGINRFFFASFSLNERTDL
jgi:hypothetical protein